VAILYESPYLCNDSKHTAMRTQHFFIFTLVILLSFPLTMVAQNHSIIVDMNEKGPTTPKPRGLIGFSTSLNQSKGLGDKDAPGVWIDLEKKEMCARFFYQGEQGSITVTNNSDSFCFSDFLRANCVNVFDLTELTVEGRYKIVIETPEKVYQGYFYYQEP